MTGTCIVGHPDSALAACLVTTGPNSLICDTTVTDNSTNVDGATTPSSSYIQNFTAGNVTGALNTGQSISGGGLVIQLSQAGASLSFTNNGAVSGANSGASLRLVSNGGNITYAGNGSVTGSSMDFGLVLNTTNGPGNITMGTSATPVTGAFSGYYAIIARTGAGASDIALNGGSITAMGVGGVGLSMTNGTGNISATLTGNTAITATGGFATGINAETAGTIAITSDANIGSTIVPFRWGISANGTGAGSVAISQTGGTILATDAGIVAGGAGPISVTTAAGSAITIAGSGNGVLANSTGSGAVTVTAGGAISGVLWGINAVIGNAANANNVTVTANGDISASMKGIAATTIGTGNLDVTVGSGATVQSTGIYGVHLSGGTANTLANNGTIIGQTGVQTTNGGTTVTNAGSITGSTGTAVNLTGGSNTFVMSGSAASLTGSAVGSGSDTFRFAGTGSNTFNVSQIGTGWTTLDKTGSSNWTLTGTSTYAGPVTVNGGILSVNGDLTSATSLSVNSGGTLGGIGTVGTTTVYAGGTLAPGNSIGTLTVNGNLTLAAGSTTVIEASSSGIDRITVSGTASLAGSLSVVRLGPSVTFGTDYTLLSAAQGRSGTFSSISALPPALRPTVTYTANAVMISFAPEALQPLLPAGTGGNQAKVAEAIDRAVGGGASVSALFPLYTAAPAAIAAGLSALSGEAATGAQQAAFNAASLFLNLMLDPTAGSRGATASGAGPSLVQMADPPGPATPGSRVAPTWSIWTKAFGQSSRTNADAAAGSARTSGGLYGVAAGADYRLAPDTLVGFALAGGGTSYGLNGRGGGTGDLFQIGLYGSTRIQDGYVSAAAAYGWNGFDIRRDVNIAGAEVYASRVTAQTYGARIEAGWRFGAALAGFGSFGWTPYAAIEAIGYSAPGYSEVSRPAGGAFGLTFAAKNTATARTELGVRLDGKARIGEGTDLITHGRLAWAYQANTERSLDASFQTLANSGFTVFGARPSMHTALASVGAELRFANGLSLTSTIEGEFGERHQAIRANAGLRYAW